MIECNQPPNFRNSVDYNQINRQKLLTASMAPNLDLNHESVVTSRLTTSHCAPSRCCVEVCPNLHKGFMRCGPPCAPCCTVGGAQCRSMVHTVALYREVVHNVCCQIQAFNISCESESASENAGIEHHCYQSIDTFLHGR